MVQAFNAGASAFFYSNESPENILHNIEQVMQNGCCITAQTFQAYKTSRYGALNADHEKALTQREKEVLQGIQKGETSRQIAAALYVSLKQ